jgi:hypothetical protein
LAWPPYVVSDIPGSEIDWSDPLAGHWPRFWPWPFRAQKKDVYFEATAASSPARQTSTRSEQEQRARLRYGGNG